MPLTGRDDDRQLRARSSLIAACPDGPWPRRPPRRRRRRRAPAAPRASAHAMRPRENTSRDVRATSTNGTSGPRATPATFRPRPNACAALLPVGAPVLEPLPDERAEPCRASLVDDDARGRARGATPASRSARLHVRLPEAVAIDVAHRARAPLARRRRCRPGGPRSRAARTGACRARSGRSTRPSRRRGGPPPGSIAPPTASCVRESRSRGRDPVGRGRIGEIVSATAHPSPHRSRRATARARARRTLEEAHAGNAAALAGLASSRRRAPRPVACGERGEACLDRARAPRSSPRRPRA